MFTATLTSNTYASRSKGVKPESDAKKAAIFAKVGNLDGFDPAPCQIMVATYIRDEVTAGGIIRPQSNLKEDEYQGKVGLIVKMGPLCFESSETHNFGGFAPKVGDWVMYRVSDGFMFQRTGQDASNYRRDHCRMIEDAMIKAKLRHPDDVL